MMPFGRLLILAFLATGAYAENKSVIAHMTNTKGAVKWAIDQGANGVELDLQFTQEGHPTEFKHGKPCDCSCTICLLGCSNYGVCSALWADVGSHCGASTPVEDMLEYLSLPEIANKLAIIYIDSKLDSSIVNYFGAGREVVDLLDRKLFRNGYKGQVIISGSKVKYIDYIKGALAAAKDSPYLNQYFYTFDAERNDYMVVWNNLLTLNTKNIFYATGITICVNGDFREAILGSKAQNGYAGIGIWTLDKKASMEEYVSYGVTSILTNLPSRAVEVFGFENLARVGQALTPVGHDLPFRTLRTCDCSYRNNKIIKLWGGGCIITKVPPEGLACRCEMNALYTCKGTIVNCKDPNSADCKNPTWTNETCRQGEGDCDGY